MRTFDPPYTAASRAEQVLAEQGYVVLDPEAVRERLGLEREGLEALGPAWDRLPPDEHLRDGGRYRRRRHGCFVVEGDTVTHEAHRAHWQPERYNALHGGIERWFEPLEREWLDSPTWRRMILGLAEMFSELAPGARWFVEAHPFRIDTTGGIGRPTPEGAHRDGVDFVALFLVAAEGIKGGETRVFDADGPTGLRFTLAEPWTAMLLDDRRVVHESTPIQPLADEGHRDTLVLTFRRDGFQAPRDGADRTERSA
ncbi:2OG-Fe dioxygenase family protein [Engelhardtia mirabilis]|uniref:2OG-Fe dioxygenase family protein n=1 Tax=Engelhardtia mirabilis TaxID=2528011 RepID=A0A518BN64_9BACT|nr:hypothetical protein Pla133_35120 [Planctomycetes bacterium Pla133]QDV02740.1 hypothetical protein Pla86_35100 [Planctomycetes bacterium Pla86]